VHKGHKPGVYTSWADAQNTIADYKGAVYKSFKTREEAQSFFKNGHPPKRVSEEPSQPSPPAKKQKRDADEPEDLVEYNAGEGPLPAGAEDGFDPRITLNPLTGKVEYKDPTTKWQAVNLRDDKPVTIYTDGSSLGNGAHGAVAGVGVYFGPKDKRYGNHPLALMSSGANIGARNLSEPLSGTRQTNQRAELTAIQRALEIAPRNRPVTIYTDSNYSIKCVTEWFVKWRANGWLNAARKPVENKDLIEKILALIDQRKNMSQEISSINKVEFVWVKGHATNEGNIAADELAVAGAREAREMITNPDFEEP
jgi:ribonuclease HI